MARAQVNHVPVDTASKVGAWCARLGLAVLLTLPGLWLFCGAPEVRRQLMLAALGLLLLSVIGIASLQRMSWGRRSVAEVGEALRANAVAGALDRPPAPGSLPLPCVLPSRRGRQFRSAAWGIALASALIGILSLAWGAAQRDETMERLHSAGAHFEYVRAEKVSNVQRKSSRGKDPYTATVVVTLPVADGRKSVATTVKTTTNDQLRTGDFVQVLYAPARPELGAVAGDKRSLEWKLRGLTMPTFERWGFIVLWVICLLASVYHVWDRYSFRSMSRLGGADRALRGSYTREGGSSAAEGGPATEGGVYLEVQTHGERVRFHADTGQFGLPEAMKGEHLWLCWDTRRGARGGRLSASRTPAALIFDTDVVVHGMISVQQARRLCGHAAPVEKTGTPARQQCSLRLFDVRSCWPLYASPLSLQAAAVVIACAVALTFEITGGWRFAFGVIGLLGVLVVAGDVLAGNVPATRVGRVPS